MTANTHQELRSHLDRSDGQEDVCLATYARSTGLSRTSGIIRSVIPPEPGEREVHGNASFSGQYVTRVASIAAQRGEGIVVLHSHPGSSGWQGMSSYDKDAERSFAYLAHEITGLPLIGMTLATRDQRWSARFWTAEGFARWAECVRVVGTQLHLSWNDTLRPVPAVTSAQLRTVSGWGEQTQADVARLRILVVGAGSVGFDVAQRLAASGVQHVSVMDFDTVKTINLDRLIGATRLDAQLHRSKAEVAKRLMRAAATAERPQVEAHDASICEPDGLAVALDYDIIFSCVDRPWPRAVLNVLAYADLIPVIDGGIAIDAFPDGAMRSATWRSHVVIPSRPCLVCNGQLRVSDVALDRGGSLDDSTYIAGADPALSSRFASQNVSMLSASVSAALLSQFVSLVAAPGGQGEPGPLQYHLAGHSLERLPAVLDEDCYFENHQSGGDGRVAMTAVHRKSREVRADRQLARRGFRVAARELLDRVGTRLHGG